MSPRTSTASSSGKYLHGFELDAEDVASIATLETGVRNGPHPDEFDAVTWSKEERAALG